MRILVTGGCGFIGSHLVDALISRGDKVIVVDDLSTGRKKNLNPKAKFRKADVTSDRIFDKLLKNVDACFHLAAIASVEKSRTEWYRTHQVNIGGLVNLYQAISASGRKIPVVYASSAAVYGNSTDEAIGENFPVSPLTPYGVDKLGCELHSKVADSVFQIPNIGLRFFNVYGPRQDPSSPYSGVISIFNNRISKGQDITVYGDGKQSRDFVYVGDVVESAIKAMDLLVAGKVKQDVINICTGQSNSLLDLIDALSKIHKNNPQVTYSDVRKGDIRMSLGNPSRAQALLGIKPETKLQDGLLKLK